MIPGRRLNLSLVVTASLFLLAGPLCAQVIGTIEWKSTIEKPSVVEDLVGKDMQSKDFLNTIKILKSTESFQDLEYHFEAGTLYFTVSEKQYISSIVWNFPKDGLAPYVERDLVVQLDLHEGDTAPTDLDARIERVKTRLRSRGYTDFDLRAKIDGPKEALRVVIDFVPSGRERDKYSRLQFSGIDDKDLMAYLARRFRGLQSMDGKSWKWQGLDYVASPCCFNYDEIELEEFKAGVRKSMRSRGFLNFDMEIVPQAGGVVSVRPRNLRRFDFQFEGQTFFWENELRTLLLENLSDRNFEIEEAKVLVQDHYLKKGFRDVAIDPVVSSKGSKFKITFNIRENQEFFFKGVDFRNVREEYLPLLRAAEKEWIEPFRSPFRYTYFDERGLRGSLGNLIDRIRARGFLDVEVAEYDFFVNSNSRFAQLKMSLRLGPRYQFSKFEINDPEKILDAANELKLPKPGDYFDGDRLQEIVRSLKRIYESQGYLYSEIDLHPEKLLQKNPLLNTVAAQINIKRGPQVYLRNLLIKGYSRTKKRIILREMGDGAIEIGDKLTPDKVREYENRLQGTGLFSTVELKPLSQNLQMQGEKALVDYELDLKERSGGTLEFGPGFRTDLGLVGFAEFGYRNIGGTNRGLFLKSTVSHKLQHYQFLQQSYSATYVEPYPFNFRSRLRFDVGYLLEDDLQYEGGKPVAGFNEEQTTFATRLEKQLTPHLSTVATLFTYELPRIFDIITQPTDSTQRYRLGGNGIEFLLDYRDDIFNPSTGYFVDTTVEYFSPYLASNRGVNFLTSKTRVNKYFNLGKGAVFAVSLGYDHLWGLNSDAIIPENKRLILGGNSSLRFLPENFLRFDQAGVAEERAFLGRAEYRIPLFADLGMASFLEMGEIDVLRDESGEGPRSTGMRTGAGFGFRYRTPVGPISVDWAYNLGQRKDEDPYQVSLSIGTF